METEADPTGEAQELRLALTAVFATLADRGPARCAATLDEAARFASRAPKRILSSIGVVDRSAVNSRFGATRALDSLCAACGDCARGTAFERPTVTADPTAWQAKG